MGDDTENQTKFPYRTAHPHIFNDLEALLRMFNVSSLKEFCSALEAEAAKRPSQRDFIRAEHADDTSDVSDKVEYTEDGDLPVEDRALHPDGLSKEKYMGEVFEVFVEALLRSWGHDTQWPSQYESTAGEGMDEAGANNPDFGVDGLAVNPEGHRCAVQVKYRTNKARGLTYKGDALAHLVSDAVLNHGVEFNGDTSEGTKFFIFTNCAGLNSFAEKAFRDNVVCVGGEQISARVDGHTELWAKMRDYINVVYQYKTNVSTSTSVQN